MIDPSTPLRDLPVAVLDCESTDYPGPDTYVVDVAVVHTSISDTTTPRVAFSSLVRPPIPIPEKATKVHGITDAMVADAPTWADVADRVAAACAGRLVVAYNAPADHTFWRVEEERISRPAPPWPFLDLYIVRRATKTRGKPGKLIEVADEYGIRLDAHGATGDGLTTAMLLTPMMRRAWSAGAFRGPAGAQPRSRYRDGWDDDEDEEDEPIRVETVGAFLAWQRGAALWQERNFCDYIRSVGGLTRPQCPWHEMEGEPLPDWPTAPKTMACPSCGAQIVMGVGKGGDLEPRTVDGSPHACPR